MQVKLFQGQTHSRLKPTNVLLFFTILLLFHLSQYYNCQSRWIPSSHSIRLPKDTFISTQESQREKVL